MITRGIIKKAPIKVDGLDLTRVAKYGVYLPLFDDNDITIAHSAVYCALPHDGTVFHVGDVVYVAGVDMDFDDLVILGMANTDNLSSAVGVIPSSGNTTTETETGLSIAEVEQLKFKNSGVAYLPNTVSVPKTLEIRESIQSKTTTTLNLSTLTGLNDDVNLGNVVWESNNGGLGFDYNQEPKEPSLQSALELKKQQFRKKIGILDQVIVTDEEFSSLVQRGELGENTIYYIYSNEDSGIIQTKSVSEITPDSQYGVYAMNAIRNIIHSYPKRINNPTYTDNNGVVHAGYGQIDDEQLWKSKQNFGTRIESTLKQFGYSVTTIQGKNPDRPDSVNNLVKSYKCVLKGLDSSKKVVIGAHYDSVYTDGIEDNGTGVAVLLELANRFRGYTPKVDIEFCFWDGEEFLGAAGSFSYVYLYSGLPESEKNILLYINLDCVGSGDNLYAYGGRWDNTGTILSDAWGYKMAMEKAEALNIVLNHIPDGINDLNQSHWTETKFGYKPPTRIWASDQQFFALNKVPYVYFEANAWLTSGGEVGNPNRPYNYNTRNSQITSETYNTPDGLQYKTENGLIIHAQKWDKYSFLIESSSSVFAKNLKAHITDVSKIVSEMIKEININSPNKYNVNESNWDA